MSEIDYKPTNDYFVEALAEAKIGDACYMADMILETIGDDHSTDDDPLWEASWTSDELQKKFELSKELHWEDDNDYVYWLCVHSLQDNSLLAVYGFDLRYNAISLGADDETMQDYSATVDVEAWREIEGVLNRYLHSAPVVDFKKADIDSGWTHLFHDLVVGLALEDDAVKIYHNKYSTDPTNPKLEKIQEFVRNRMARKYDLPEVRIDEVIRIVERSAEEKNNGN